MGYLPDDYSLSFRMRVSWYTFRLKIIMRIAAFFHDLSTKICDHSFCAIVTMDNGKHLEICTICEHTLEEGD